MAPRRCPEMTTVRQHRVKEVHTPVHPVEWVLFLTGAGVGTRTCCTMGNALSVLFWKSTKIMIIRKRYFHFGRNLKAHYLHLKVLEALKVSLTAIGINILVLGLFAFILLRYN